MDFKALIDFNKYTLALAAAGFVYALEKLAPMPTLQGRYLLFGLLLIFLLSCLFGVGVFAAATRALHSDGAEKENLERIIQKLGTTHAVLLAVGMLVLGAMIVPRIFAPPTQTRSSNLSSGPTADQPN